MFQKVVYINLEHRKDRKSFMEPQLKEVQRIFDWEGSNIKCERFQAVRGLDFEGTDGGYTIGKMDFKVGKKTLTNIAQKKRNKHSELDSWGGVGCFYSHLSVWQALLESGDDAWLVLEDDVTLLEPKFHHLLATLQLPQYEFLMFDIDIFGKKVNVGHNMFRLSTFWGAHAYLLNRSGAEKAVAYAKEIGVDMQLDYFIGHMASKGIISGFSLNNKWFRQEQKRFSTDIQMLQLKINTH